MIVYWTHRRFLDQARACVTDFLRREGRVPTPQEYRETAIRWLDDLPAAGQ